MVILSLFSWWYTTGWLTLMRKCGDRIQHFLKFFSVGMLVGSLFAPFRQISVGRVEGPINVQLSAWVDRLFSRIIGAIVRSFLIVIGLASTAVLSLVCLAIIIVWPLLPAAPLIGFLFGGRV